MAKFFIEHPVLANVLAIVLVLIGAVAIYNLPVAQYPNIVPPTVQVTTRYPGASPQTVIDTIALPIELQVNGVDGMLYMQSTSAADGTYSLIMTFKIGMDPDTAQVLVQNRVSNVLASLPQAVQAQGVSVQKKSTAILQIVTLNSPGNTHDALYLSNYATINLGERAGPFARCRECNSFRRRRICDANLAGIPRSSILLGLCRGDVVEAVQAAESGGRGRTDRHAAGAGQPRLPIYRRYPVPVRRSQPIRGYHRQRADRPRRPA